MMMGGSLVKWGNPREPVLARADHPGAGRGRVSSARTQLLLPARPVWPLSARAPCLRLWPGSGSGRVLRVRSVECGHSPVSGSVSVLSTWCGRAHHITVSITSHESDTSAQSYHHQQPGPSQVWTVCYEQVKAEHISQWVPGNQGSDHTRTKTKLAITFAQLARKPQNVDAQHCGLSPAHRDVPRGVQCGHLPRHLHRAHHHLHHPGQCPADNGSSQHKCEALLLSSASGPSEGGSL